jgi:hypothetical protein
MKSMYHPDDLAAMDPLVLMKNLDHVRMTSRRLSYILQQQVHLYTPQANQLREQIDTYVEAERQIEGEMARRRIRAYAWAITAGRPRPRRSPTVPPAARSSSMTAAASSARRGVPNSEKPIPRSSSSAQLYPRKSPRLATAHISS